MMLILLISSHSILGEESTAIATVRHGFVTGILVTSRGSGYLKEPSVILSGGGGSGATAVALLHTDQVDQIVVLTAGNGYTEAPKVTIENLRSPIEPKALLDLHFKWVPAISVTGPKGTIGTLQWSEFVAGPWTTWTNITAGIAETTLVDLSGWPGTVFIGDCSFDSFAPSDVRDFCRSKTRVCAHENNFFRSEFIGIKGE